LTEAILQLLREKVLFLFPSDPIFKHPVVAVKLDLRFSQKIETLNDLVTIHLQVGFYLFHSLGEQFLFSFSHMLICKNAKTLYCSCSHLEFLID
jgi:hypothetical protein